MSKGDDAAQLFPRSGPSRPGHCAEIVLNRMRNALVRPLRNWFIKTALKAAECVQLGTFRVYSERPLSDQTMASLHDALRLIEEIDARRYRRMSADIPNLLLVTIGGGHVYSELKTGALEYRVIDELSVPGLAGYLVELGARARIAHAPFARNILSKDRHRVWERAIREEIAFLSRLPPREFIEVENLIKSLLDTIPNAH